MQETFDSIVYFYFPPSLKLISKLNSTGSTTWDSWVVSHCTLRSVVSAVKGWRLKFSQLWVSQSLGFEETAQRSGYDNALCASRQAGFSTKVRITAPKERSHGWSKIFTRWFLELKTKNPKKFILDKCPRALCGSFTCCCFFCHLKLSQMQSSIVGCGIIMK